MTSADTTDWFEFWAQRELPFIRYAPYVLLVVASGLDIGVHHGLTTAARVDLGLAAAVGAWMLAWQRRLRDECTEPNVAGVVFFLGLLALDAALVVRAPIFGFYAFTGYVWVFRSLWGYWRIAGVLANAAIVAISQDGGAPKLTPSGIGIYILIFLINAFIAGGLMWFGFVGNEQKARREQMIADLTETNRKLEDSLAENAALQARLLAQAREAGIGEERQRLAREIHDTLAQSLIGIITQLQAAEALPAGAPGRASHLDAAVALARESLTEARRSVRALAPEPLELARLPEAIADVASRWSALNGIEATVTTTGAARAMRPEIEVALLRTAQEALANVAKHAEAHRVGLTLSYMQDVVTLDVRDDGVGFTPGAGVRRADGGFGLAAMRQRIQGVAGRLEIESEPDGGGTAICASIPAVPAEGAAG